MKNIVIQGARLHNLKGIDISIPKNKLVVMTGVSGSGKSSLAFDIIFEEGRKQYLQSLGVFTALVEEDKFDHIAGISPTIAVQQNMIRQRNTRSTVGTKTNILKMMALLFAMKREISCSVCGTMLDSYFTCPQCEHVEESLPVGYFLYNNPNGMCIRCSGKGTYAEINLNTLIPDEHTTLKQVLHTVNPKPGYLKLFYKKFADYIDMPFTVIPDEVKLDILYGQYVESNSQHRSYCLHRILENRFVKDGDNSGGLFELSECTACQGFRIGEEARNVTLNGKHIGELASMTLTDLKHFIVNLLEQEDRQQQEMKETAKREYVMMQDILQKMNSLIKIRLGHLSLYRELPSLSGGELQRVFLHDHLESKMDGMIYILDEPTAGLHEREKLEVLQSIRHLQELGNTVIVVEHDKKTIEMADYIIEIGPKAGVEGGQVVYQGSVDGFMQSTHSISAPYFSGKTKITTRTNPSMVMTKHTPKLTISGANIHHLKHITASIPLGMLVGVTGVSGSGKSSLISNALVSLLHRHFHQQVDNETYAEDAFYKKQLDGKRNTVEAGALEGVTHISDYVEVSQVPIGRNKNSTILSYIGIWEKVRKLFAEQPEAKEQHLTAGHFSFNTKGACATCEGNGQEKQWLGGNYFIYSTCKDCHGKRYNDEVLSVTYKGKHIAHILDMTITEAITFFADHKAIIATLNILHSMGMGYMTLGQPTPTLSGGEAQRVKLAKELGKRRKEQTLYILDEPTVGLSLYDTAKLMSLLDELVVKGNSVIVIEHDTEVLSACDWLIELGPDGGAGGGEIIAEGTPDTLKDNPNSIIGRYLRLS
ncbi:excinuclease ABC subunit UvrA [Longirhabdus pacifica]|uniref:excinuclease ABC subunit UvrA n=1 Tax=Longirhabdus pacifica TaxID=2305227 RepID=UPI0010090F6D|nr:excinuclease ABC subunit UvrA [Longirhabdus pacifica]